MLEILAITTPIFLLIGVGYAAVRSHYFDPAGLRFLGAYVVRLGLPVLMFRAVAQRPIADVLNLRYLAGYAAGSLAILGLGVLATGWLRRRELDTATLQAMGMTMPNSMFVGLPVAMQVFPASAGLAMALCVVVENLLLLPLCLALVESASARHQPFGKAFLRTLSGLPRNPMILALALGLACSLLGLHLPVPLGRAVDLVAAGSAPVALFCIGGSLVGQPWREMLADVAAVSFGKLVMHPLLVLGALLLLYPRGGELAMCCVLIASSSMMSIYPIIGQQYGRQGECAAALLAATVSAFFTMTGVIWLLRNLSLFAAG